MSDRHAASLDAGFCGGDQKDTNHVLTGTSLSLELDGTTDRTPRLDTSDLRLEADGVPGVQLQPWHMTRCAMAHDTLRPGRWQLGWGCKASTADAKLPLGSRLPGLEAPGVWIPSPTSAQGTDPAGGSMALRTPPSTHWMREKNGDARHPVHSASRSDSRSGKRAVTRSCERAEAAWQHRASLDLERHRKPVSTRYGCAIHLELAPHVFRGCTSEDRLINSR